MTVEDLERVKRSVIRRYPISAGLALHGVTIELSKEVGTAAVVGVKNDQGIIEVDKILVNPDFMDCLSFGEKVFVLAHEALHIALKHFARSIDKPEADATREYEEYCEREQDEAKREAKKAYLQSHYQRIWNIATDACINAFLKRDGFTFPENVPDPKTGKPMQFVDMKDGLIRSAEKIYDALLRKEKEEKERQKKKELDKNQEQNNNGNQEQSNSEQDNNNHTSQRQDEDDSFIDELPDPDDYDGFDSHEYWNNDKLKNNSKETGESKKTSQSRDQSQTMSVSKPEHVDEEDVLKKELEKREKKDSRDVDKKNPFSSLRSKLGIPDVKTFKPVLSWKRVLADTQERIVEVWGTRRASRFNPNARIEERTEETSVSVEVILDVSGSISLELLRGFLSQLYPIFETLFGTGNVKLKVGTFADNFSGFQIISSREDIANFDPEIGGATNYELAATSFSQNKGEKVVKIVFTDGRLDRYPEHVQKTRVTDIIWIVFGDKMDFTPLGGRIIRVSEKEYNDMLASGLIYQSDNGYYTSRM